MELGDFVVMITQGDTGCGLKLVCSRGGSGGD